MNIHLKPLKQQVVVITGASSGIGLVTARMASRKGAAVVLAARNVDAIRQLADEIHTKGGRAIYVQADVGIEEDINRVAHEAVTNFGWIDTWVNNAGVSIFGHADEVSIPDMKRMFDTVFWGVVYGSRAATQQFKRQGSAGALINVGSFFGDRATVLQSTYSAAKHALHGWTEALRMELEKEKAPVSVTLIHPGRIDTPYNEHAQSYIRMQPTHQGMVYPPEAVAEAILLAATKPKRHLYVGFQARFFTLLSSLSPRFLDKVIEAYLYPTQQSKHRQSHNEKTSALHKAGYGLKERGSHEGWMRSGSLYVKAAKHPVLAGLAVAGLATSYYFLKAVAKKGKG
jgi:short-subunit dehydrogenase